MLIYIMKRIKAMSANFKEYQLIQKNGQYFLADNKNGRYHGNDSDLLYLRYHDNGNDLL